MKTNDVYSMHEQLFAAAAGEVAFADALSNIVAKFGGAGGVVFELNRKTGAISNWVGPGLEEGEQDYINHLNAINPRMHYSLRHAAGHVVHESKFIDERTIDRHEFYDAIYKVGGVKYFLGTRIVDDGDVSLFHSIEFTPKHGHPDQQKISSFSRMAPAIGNAWRLASRHSNSNVAESAKAWTPDHLPWGIFAFGPKGTVVSHNRQAGLLLDRAGPLELIDDILIARDRRSVNDFDRALYLGLNGTTAEALLLSKDHTSPLIAQIVPTGIISKHSPVAALLYVWDPLEQSARRDQVLKNLYQFTPAELALAGKLATGSGLAVAADCLCISRNTARNQLHSMFQKTGTRRQGELIVQILGVLRR